MVRTALRGRSMLLLGLGCDMVMLASLTTALLGTGEREETISATIGAKSIAIFDATDAETLRNQLEVTFPSTYGAIVAYEWFCTHFLCVGFESGTWCRHVATHSLMRLPRHFSQWPASAVARIVHPLAGYVAVVSASPRADRGSEIYSTRLFRGGLASFAVSPLLSRAAACSGSMVRMLALSAADVDGYRELDDEAIEVHTSGASLQSMAWTTDGQILTVASDAGVVYNFLASLPVLAATHGSRYLYLTSLLKLSIFDSDVGRRSAPPLEVFMHSFEQSLRSNGQHDSMPLWSAALLPNIVTPHTMSGVDAGLLRNRAHFCRARSITCRPWHEQPRIFSRAHD